MGSTLFQAPPYDPRRDRRRNLILGGLVVAILIVAALAFLLRNWPYERVVDRFFTAIEHNDLESAYAIWMADPDWKQHPAKYSQYTFGQFQLDWGPSGEWGKISKHHIVGSARPPKGGSGVVVVVRLNGRAEEARLWVEKKDKSLTFSPY